MRTGPVEHTPDLGETVRGFRTYIGLSRAAMADRIDMTRKTYERIEESHQECPPGLLDTLTAVVLKFDAAVKREVCTGLRGSGATLFVHGGVHGEWGRCVANRAAMMSDKITVILTR